MILFGPALFAAVLLAAGCEKSVIISPPGTVACTMEAKQCPDGSSVGRTGPKCEFTACPAPAPTPPPTPNPVGKSCDGPGDARCGSGYQCIQDCGPPVVREGEPPAPYHCQTDAFAKKPRMCPICLASNTLIATPSGEVSVKDVTPGMRVWSLDARGERVVSTVIRISRTPVPETHRVVHLVLLDKRQVWVSPGHPTVNSEPVGALHPGDSYDGTIVVSADLVSYWDRSTYDLLTDSATGGYWANGIPLKSTLIQK